MDVSKKIILILAMAWNCGLLAQQLPQFTQYMFNTISVNPAYAGSRERLNLTALHRNQWEGIDGNPHLFVHSCTPKERSRWIGFLFH